MTRVLPYTFRDARFCERPPLMRARHGFVRKGQADRREDGDRYGEKDGSEKDTSEAGSDEAAGGEEDREQGREQTREDRRRPVGGRIHAPCARRAPVLAREV